MMYGGIVIQYEQSVMEDRSWDVEKPRQGQRTLPPRSRSTPNPPLSGVVEKPPEVVLDCAHAFEVDSPLEGESMS